MRRFTKKEIETLSAAEDFFAMSLKASYKRATTSAMDKMVVDTWNKANESQERPNMSCGACSFNFYKKVGRKYFEDKQYYADKQNKILEKARAAKAEKITQDVEGTEPDSEVIENK